MTVIVSLSQGYNESIICVSDDGHFGRAFRKITEKTLKIAIVSDDHQAISAHFGRAQFYEIFTIDAGKITNRETVSRSFPQVVPVDAALDP